MATRFLEFAVPSSDVLESLGFYRDLGFTELTTQDSISYAYAVVTDGRIMIGLHGIEDVEPSVRFVRPNVREAVLKLGERGIEFEDVHLDEDELHRVSVRGPSGNRVTWLEARTYSPPLEDVGDSLLGRFLELTFPVTELYEAAHFWAPYAERVTGESKDPPRMRFDAGGLPLGLSETRDIKAPALAFIVDDTEGLQQRLDRTGISLDVGALPVEAFATIRAPEGSLLALYRKDFMQP